jgi:AraC-like DNA-binding protein
MEDQVKKMTLALLGYAAQRDIPVEQLCLLSGVSISELHNDQPLSSRQISNIWMNVIHQSNDELFGLHFGESLQLAALGVVGDVIKSSATVGNALQLCISLTHRITSRFKVEVIHGEHTFTLRFNPLQENWENNPVMLQTLNLLMVFVIHELNGFLLRKIVPVAVNFSFASVKIDEYHRVMRCMPVFGSTENSLTFDHNYWDEPIITADYKLQQLLLASINPQLLPFSLTKQSLGKRIENYMLSNSYLTMVSLDDIASNFNISTRTLQRKLKVEGINFQQLAEEVRKTLAINYLKKGAHPVKEVSHMLGYNELSAFNRAFKRWTGVSPGLYQKNFN